MSKELLAKHSNTHVSTALETNLSQENIQRQGEKQLGVKNVSHAEGTGVAVEEQKQLLVADSHAVVDPRTMVVHLDDAALTEAAVVRPRRLERIAPVRQNVDFVAQQHTHLRENTSNKAINRGRTRASTTHTCTHGTLGTPYDRAYLIRSWRVWK